MSTEKEKYRNNAYVSDIIVTHGARCGPVPKIANLDKITSKDKSGRFGAGAITTKIFLSK